MRKSARGEAAPNGDAPVALTVGADAGFVLRLQTRDLYRQTREAELAHDGRIYRLRLTQLNKLILTA